jgi:UDP-N-acetylmuramate dehydrogenase
MREGDETPVSNDDLPVLASTDAIMLDDQIRRHELGAPTATFADLTTIRTGGPIRTLHIPETTEDVIELVREADAVHDPVLIMGGGSNLVVGDAGWDGTVIKVATSALDIDGERVTAAAGLEWDYVVWAAMSAGLAGLEALSGIPGSVGGTPVQNVGAYGALISELLASVTVFDRSSGETEIWGPERCGFGSHRQSIFKHSERWVILDVTLKLERRSQTKPINYSRLAGALGIPEGGTAAVTDVRDGVLALRRASGMVLDPADRDTWSVGSFFINPVLAKVPERASKCPQYPDTKGTKLSAAWLIHNAGFPPGYGRDWGNGTVALSSRHALAVTNRGGAATSDIMRFAAHIRDGVEACYDVRLGPECDLVNCAF